jgi:hypothetical protein
MVFQRPFSGLDIEDRFCASSSRRNPQQGPHGVRHPAFAADYTTHVFIGYV